LNLRLPLWVPRKHSSTGRGDVATWDWNWRRWIVGLNTQPVSEMMWGYVHVFMGPLCLSWPRPPFAWRVANRRHAMREGG
jgi:hypothetical protein